MMANQGYIQITRKCNQSCRFCSNPEREETLEMNDVKTMIDEIVSLGYKSAIFTGGEPTLHEQLPDFISLARSMGLESRIITNGQKLSDNNYLKELERAGLDCATVSVYSNRNDVHDSLSCHPGSLSNIISALNNLSNYQVEVNVATVINSFNSDHLDNIVSWITGEFPFIKHFIWNNLDPHMNRTSNNPDVIPSLADMELSLFKACGILESKNCTFRIERVPLCFMAEYAHCSTETRKIVKREERLTYFLDEKGRILQTEFQYVKAACCAHCDLNQICVGLYMGDRYFNMDELHAVFTNAQIIIDKIFSLP